MERRARLGAGEPLLVANRTAALAGPAPGGGAVAERLCGTEGDTAVRPCATYAKPGCFSSHAVRSAASFLSEITAAT